MNLFKKKVLVLGFGLTGEAVCRFLIDQAAEVKVSEKLAAEKLGKDLSPWREHGVTFETGEHQLNSFLETDLIIPSPGIPFIPELQKARARGIPILSEIELASRFLKGKIIGVTGSNGKSTVVTLIHKIFKEGGEHVFLAGNIGQPLIGFVKDSRETDIYATELSSFQLAFTKMFKPYVSIFLNITPDHLDWHPDFEDYFSAKQQILANQGPQEMAILNRDDPAVWSLRDSGSFQTYGFSTQAQIDRGCYLRDDLIIFKQDQEKELMSVKDISLIGKHNQENVLAAALTACLYSLPTERIETSIKSFQGLEHRLEKVMTLNGIDIYNDSKATNVDAALKSIQSFGRPLVLILGGKDKGGNFQLLRESVKSHVRHFVLVGDAREKIRQALEDTVPYDTTDSFEEAVRTAVSAAKAGEVVLLAPACTSFDMFKSFGHRGRVFKEIIFSLADADKRQVR